MMRLKIKEMALFAMLGAITFAAKVVMMVLPNIEPVSLMVILFTLTFGRKALYPIYIYVVLEFLLYGFNLWSINYLYVWAILAFVAWILHKHSNPLMWAIVSGSFGLLFGLLCAPVYLFTGGAAFAVSWWISGIPFDLLHCAGNFVMAIVLFTPLHKLLNRLYQKLQN